MTIAKLARSAAIIAAFMTYAATAAARPPDRVEIMLHSAHVADRYGFNDNTPGVFLGWTMGRNVLSVGAYRNSFRHLSVAVSLYHRLIGKPGAEIGIAAGLANYPVDGRYQAVHVGILVPMIGLQAQYRHLLVQVYPGDGRATKAVIAFGLTFNLR